MTDVTALLADHKRAKLALCVNSQREFVTIARKSIPMIPGVGSSGQVIAEALIRWVDGRDSFTDAHESIMSAINFIDAYRATAVLAKWLLSGGFFTATVFLQENYFSCLSQRLVWLRTETQRQRLMVAAVHRSDRQLLALLAGRSDLNESLFPTLRTVARLAIGTHQQVAPSALSRAVAGAHVGVLGPSPVSASVRDEIAKSDIVVAPVSPTRQEGLLVVPRDVDVAYVLPWQGHLDVRWKPSGILVVRGEPARSATHNFGGGGS